METMAFVLSTFGTICICIPPLLKGKNMKLTLMLVFLANAFVAASYLLTGATAGTLIRTEQRRPLSGVSEAQSAQRAVSRTV